MVLGTVEVAVPIPVTSSPSQIIMDSIPKSQVSHQGSPQGWALSFSPVTTALKQPHERIPAAEEGPVGGVCGAGR